VINPDGQEALLAGAFEVGDDIPTQFIELQLAEGWNLVALPFTPRLRDPLRLFGSDTLTVKLVKEINKGVRGRFKGIQYTYDEVTALQALEGYFVYIPSATGRSISVLGDPLASTVDLPITVGWNIIGVPDPQNAGQFRERSTLIKSVQRYDTPGQAFSSLANADFMEPGVGYFVFVKSDLTIRYTLTGEGRRTAK
jgi:hypothetical protein